jgi:Domain of unknown function (DUF4365)
VIYDLAVANYNDLRMEEAGTPRILVLLVMPDDEERWIEQTEEMLLLRHCAYWVSLKGMPATSNTKTVRISVPRVNVFSVNGLRALMDKVRRKEL